VAVADSSASSRRTLLLPVLLEIATQNASRAIRPVVSPAVRTGFASMMAVALAASALQVESGVIRVRHTASVWRPMPVRRSVPRPLARSAPHNGAARV